MHASHCHHASTTLASAQAFTARNLALLAAIEQTLDVLDSDIELFSAIHRGYEEVKDNLTEIDSPIDADGHIQAALNDAGQACARIYHGACKRHRSACTDPQLQSDDGVTDDYSKLLAVLQDLHDVIEGLREWIAVHDAVLQPSLEGTYADVDELFDALLPAQ